MITYSCQDASFWSIDYTSTEARDLLMTGVTAMSQVWKLKQSRNEWKRKAVERADEIRYLRKELNRVKGERNRLSEESKEPKAPEESPP